MQLTDKLAHVVRHAGEIRRALDVLRSASLDDGNLTELEHEVQSVILTAENFVPAEYPDRFRIRAVPVPISEHIAGDNVMTCSNLHAPSSNGRSYTLTPGQRTVLRDRYGMTPTKTVVVEEIAIWPAAPTCVRHVILRSNEHVPNTRKHVLNRAIIDDWVSFCDAALTIDSQEAESASSTGNEDQTAKKKIVKAGNENMIDLFNSYL